MFAEYTLRVSESPSWRAAFMSRSVFPGVTVYHSG